MEASAPESRSVAASAIAGARWNYLGSLASTLASLIIGTVLARLLGPGPFGQAIVATTIFSLANFFVDGGFSQALIQQRELSPELVRRTFTLQVLSGAFATAAVYAAAPWLADRFHVPSAAPVVRALAALLTLQSSGLVSAALLRRQMRFRTVQTATLVSYLVGYLGLGIPLAMQGAGVWSLVAAYLGQAGCNAAILYACARHPIAPSFGPPPRSVTVFGGTIILNNLVNWGHANLDNLAASQRGAPALGLYGRSSNLAYQPCNAMAAGLQSVLLSSSARVQGNKPLLGRMALASVALMLGVLGPAYAVFVSSPATVIGGLYGPRWAAAAPIMVPLALAMPLFGCISLLNPILCGMGRPALEFWPQAISCALAAVAYFAAVRVSLPAVGWALLGVMTIRFLLTAGAAFHALGVNAATVLKTVAARVAFAAAFGGCAAGLDRALARVGLAASPRLAILFLVSAALLAAAVWFFARLVFGADAVEFLLEYRTHLPSAFAARLSPSRLQPGEQHEGCSETVAVDPPKARVLILQAMCKQYRVPLFAEMHRRLAERGIELRVAYGPAPPGHRERNDNVELAPEYGIVTRSRSWLGGRLLWQCPAGAIRQADLVIVEHAAKHVIQVPLLALSWIKAKKLGFWTHGGSLRHPATSKVAAWLRPLRRTSLLAADHIFAYTRGTARDLIALGARPDRTTALQNSIDLQSFRAALDSLSTTELAGKRARLGIPADAHIALYCGSLYPGRGMDFLLAACDRVAKADPLFQLLLVGAGPLEPELRQAAANRAWLHVLGSKFGNLRAPYFRLSQLCLMPYLAGLGILDAMAAGLPYLVTGARATNPEIEYLVDGVTGLITGDSVEAYADAIAALFADPVRLAAMAEASRTASLGYSIEQMAENFCAGIEACLAEPLPAARAAVVQVAAAPHPALHAPIRLAVLMTCYNRREKTLATLRSLDRQTAQRPRMVRIILVDDGSRDQTTEAVRAEFPQVEILPGTGSLFWNGGMRVAFARAQQIGFDQYLLLNDDTLLAPHCLDTLLATAEQLEAQGVPSIVAASTCDPETGNRTYGGMRRRHTWRGVQDTFLAPDPERPLRCDTMNGNCTLIPSAIARVLGNLEPGFRQQFGDYDYGFRATRAGFAVHIAPGYLGRCPNNPITGTWRDPKLGRLPRWQQLMSPKGVPWRDWLLFSRRHCGYLWPLYFLSPYLKVSLAGLAGERRVDGQA